MNGNGYAGNFIVYCAPSVRPLHVERQRRIHRRARRPQRRSHHERRWQQPPRLHGGVDGQLCSNERSLQLSLRRSLGTHGRQRTIPDHLLERDKVRRALRARATINPSAPLKVLFQTEGKVGLAARVAAPANRFGHAAPPFSRSRKRRVPARPCGQTGTDRGMGARHTLFPVPTFGAHLAAAAGFPTLFSTASGVFGLVAGPSNALRH